ncbi:hypothetical protein BHM03_00029213 [Ensete ventricosum]|nr:hypothetical protein BHM03_00029213 [Ensete ventricosum]
MEEEEGSSNVSCGGGVTVWAVGGGVGARDCLLANCVVRDHYWVRPNCYWPQEIAAGHKRSLLAALCSERSLLATLCSEGLLLAVSKADGSWQHCVVAMCAAVEGIKGDLVPERLVGRRLKAAVRV